MSRTDEPSAYASPPCYLGELEDPAPAIPAEVAVRLNELLEGERAGAKGILDMNVADDEALATVLDDVARDEARFCAMLRRHLTRLGYEPSRDVGVFYEKLASRPSLDDKLRLLDRGQSAVVRMLDALLPSIEDDELRIDLEEMRDTHIRNIETCAQFLAS